MTARPDNHASEQPAHASPAAWECFARCASGFEPTLAAELKGLRVLQVRPLQGGVSFSAALEQLYGVCLGSRVATRVQVVLARVGAADADSLYAGVRAFPWEGHILPGATVAVRAHGTNRKLRNTQFTALKVKDALCDRLRQARGARPDVDAHDPDFAIDVSVHRDRATVYLNASGASLHRRGYRQDGEQTVAPCKETLAAGILLAAGWDRSAREGAAFFDPMCGSGTFAIEAVLIALRRAPGLMRERWGFQGWVHHDEQLFVQVRDRVQSLAVSPDTSGAVPLVIAADSDPAAIEIARANAHRAQVDHVVQFLVRDASQAPSYLLECAHELPPQGLVASNPPYGHRMESPETMQPVYRALASAIEAVPGSWRVALITSDAAIDTALGRTPAQVVPCFNGPIEASVRLYDKGDAPASLVRIVSLGGVERAVPVAEPNTQQFADRVRKVAKERARWARKAGVTCYRVYDADLPDYAVAIDLYASIDDGLFARVAEYRAPRDVDADRAARRLSDALAAVPAVFDIEPDHVLCKVRHQDKGGGQYRDARGASRVVHVHESGHTFEIDLGGYLDTGLFLDHRPTREMVGRMAQGTRFLNLFAYTGAATVHAAAGGAAGTTTVDMSRTYLEWAKRNMAANGFDAPQHAYVQDNCLQWLASQARTGERFDLVFCDPPTFSNSKRMNARSFDVQRDHVSLLEAVRDILAPDGTIVFSCNLRSFKIDLASLAERGLEATDITAQTIPHDFARTPKIHSCYLVRRSV